ncbi:DUF4198 domain-containing protein [Acinetobacter variabilis]|uniref:DUF4198 domain-containing protein n=1 Tax=Acinetobacter variabilis TaxID=70346 RepID=UPI001BB69633|nr:DUF4198 domain-containing protein [Acinetobacter variabilis]BCT89218.1 hypothetical protein RYU24_16230 [Acinetobacter variabilis]
MKKLITLTIGLSLTLSAQAHMLWLERASDAKTHAFFGEYSEQLKETQEGALKSFNQAKAIQSRKTFSPQMQQDHLLYATQGQTDVQLSHELIYGESLLSYHAKSGRQNLKAESELDIVPTQINSNTFTVLYQGKPAADVEVTVFSPQFWLKKYTTNSQGQITIATPWKGQYVIEVGKEADKAGKLNQQVYKKQYLVTTLSFVH